MSDVGWVDLRRRADRARRSCTRIRARFPNARLGNGFGLTETSSIVDLPARRVRRHSRRRRSGFAAPTVEVDLDSTPTHGDGRRRTARSAGQNVVAGLLEQARSRPRRRSSTAGCTPATSRASTTTASSQIVDRMKDMINRGGENVYCVEVENVLAAAPGRVRGRRARRARRDDGREGRRGRRAAAGMRDADRRGFARSPRTTSPTSRCRSSSACAASRCRATRRQGAQTRSAQRHSVERRATLRR